MLLPWQDIQIHWCLDYVFDWMPFLPTICRSYGTSCSLRMGECTFVFVYEPTYLSFFWLQDSGSRIWIYALRIDTNASRFFHIQDCNFCSSYRGCNYCSYKKDLKNFRDGGRWWLVNVFGFSVLKVFSPTTLLNSFFSYQPRVSQHCHFTELLNLSYNTR